MTVLSNLIPAKLIQLGYFQNNTSTPLVDIQGYVVLQFSKKKISSKAAFPIPTASFIDKHVFI